MILIILAGISIANLTGENGLIARANKAKEMEKEASAREKLQLEILGSYNTNGKLDIEELKKNIGNIGIVTNPNVDKFPLEANVDGYIYEILETGTISSNYVGDKDDTGEQGSENKGITLEEVQELIEKSKEEIKLEAFPIGSVYISTTDANPSTYLGGTWESYGEGKTLLSSNGVSGQTGGANTVTLSVNNLPSHTHTYAKSNSSTEGHVLTISQIPKGIAREMAIPSGTWSMGTWGDHGSGWGTMISDWYSKYNSGDNGYSQAHSHTIKTTDAQTTSTGSGDAINVQNPYITVHVWKRIE